MSPTHKRFYQMTAVCCLLTSLATAQSTRAEVGDFSTEDVYVEISLITPAVMSARYAARRTQSLSPMDEMLRLYDGETLFVGGVVAECFSLPPDDENRSFEPDLLLSFGEGIVWEVMFVGADDDGVYLEDAQGVVIHTYICPSR